jgi:LysR family transcriptional regulator, benzoate and cis,cis-muconate-responsive activator of ben and cat genes
VTLDLTPTPPAIELRHLRCIHAVVEERDLDRAAERLRMQRRTLSDALRVLEDELAVTLVSSETPMVTPTAPGRVLAGEAREILAKVDRALADARRAGGLGATLRVGWVPDLALQRLQAFLGPLYQRAPDLDVEVTHLRTAEQLSRLRFGELDLGIVHDTGAVADIESRPLFPGERIAAFLPVGHRLASRAALGPDELVCERLLVSPRAADPALADRLDALLAGEGYRFGGVRELRGEDARDALFAVAEGRGVTLGPASTMRVVGEAATIVSRHALQPPLWMPDTAIAWRMGPSPQLATALAAAREVARDLHGRSAPPTEG